VTVSHTGFQFDFALVGWVAVPDQRSLLRGRIANAIGDVVDVASRLGPPATQATRATAPPPTPPPLESVGRPWTLAAAMEPVLAPIVDAGAAPTSSGRPVGPPPPPEHHHSRIPNAVIGSSFLVLVVVIAVHLLNGGAAVQAPTHSIGRISLTGVRPVASASASGGAVPATQVSFPAMTTVVDIEVNSGGAGGQAPVQVVVTAGQPAQTIINNAYVLSQSGDTVIPLTPPGSVFAPGNYAVTITYRGALVGSTAFAVH
jgi:hypothetical protein